MKLKLITLILFILLPSIVVDCRKQKIEFAECNVVEIEELKPFSSKAIVHVKRIIDGDTFETLHKNKVRLIGIDTPERNTPGYTEAKNALARLIEGKKITMISDVQATDKYGRLLAYVYLPNKKDNKKLIFVNQFLVYNGLANIYTVPPNVRYADEFLKAQQHAREKQIGLWKVDRPLEDYYIASRNSNVFHRPNCTSADKIKKKNIVRFKSKDEALDKGLAPCRKCKP